MIAIHQIESVRQKIQPYIAERIEQFKRLKTTRKTLFSFQPFLNIPPYEADIFSEACFCILTANSSASLGIKIQAEVGIEGFREYSQQRLFEIIARKGHRFAAQRAERIVLLRRNEQIILSAASYTNSRQARELLVKNINGYGYKEASHFLRNIGFDDIGIIDRHIYRFLVETGLVEPRKTLTKKAYLECEDVLLKLCDQIGVSMAELDLYIFYIKTKKVLK